MAPDSIPATCLRAFSTSPHRVVADCPARPGTRCVPLPSVESSYLDPHVNVDLAVVGVHGGGGSAALRVGAGGAGQAGPVGGGADGRAMAFYAVAVVAFLFGFLLAALFAINPTSSEG